MPYRRKTNRKRRPRKTNYMGSAVSAYKLAKQAYSQIKYLKSLINVEKKKFDLELTSSAISNSGQIYSLCAIAQGDTDQTRNGNSILCQHVSMRGRLLQSNSITTTLRLMLFMDTQQISDTAPIVSDVLDTTFSNYFQAPLNNLTVGRFKILWDKQLNSNPGQSAMVQFKHFQRLTGHHVRFNGTAAGDSQKGTLYLLAISDQPTLTPTLDFASRLTFTDN